MPKILNARHGGTWPHSNSIYVGRGTPWGNPFHIGEHGTRDEVVEKYRTYATDNPQLLATLEKLRGKDLVCWCAPLRCHAEVLLELLEGSMPDGTTTVVVAAPQLTVAQMIEKYIALRDKKDEIKKQHTKQLEPFNQVMDRLEGMILDQLNQNNLDSMRSENGTAFKSTETSVTVKNWQETFGFIQSNGLWDLLEARVNKTAALSVIEESKAPIPGVNVTQTTVVRVRRA